MSDNDEYLDGLADRAANADTRSKHIHPGPAPASPGRWIAMHDPEGSSWVDTDYYPAGS